MTAASRRDSKTKSDQEDNPCGKEARSLRVFILIGFGFADHDLAFHRQDIEANGEALPVCVGPGGTGATEVGFLTDLAHNLSHAAWGF